MLCVGHCHLLSVLFKESELETLIQFELPDVPHLMKMLPGGVQLIQETGHLAQRMINMAWAIRSHFTVHE